MSELKTPLLIALHGWGAHGSFFDDLALRLTDCCEILAPDLAGHGVRQHQETVDLSLLAAQINEIVQEHSDRPIFLLGWSMGAGAAFTYLERYGDANINGLILEDMSPKPINDADWNLGIASGYRAQDVEPTLAHIRAGWQRYGRRVWRATFADPETARVFEEHPLYEAFLDNREAPMASAWTSLMELDARSTIKTLEFPVLALMGAESHVYDRALSDWYDRVLKNGIVERLAGAGHAPHLEQPKVFADHVAAFIQKHC